MKKAIVIFSTIAILVFCCHFAFVVIYCFRDNLPQKVTRYSDRYVVPMFHQNWKLFAPEIAKYNAELEYRIAGDGNWSSWLDASGAFGFGPTSRIETIEQGFVSGLSWQVVNNFYSKNGRAQFDRIVASYSYASALYFVMKLHNLNQPKIPIDSVQIRLNFRFTPPPQNAYTMQSSYLEFPIYAPPSDQ